MSDNTKKERIYCINPVRKVMPDLADEILAQVEKWELEGHAVRCALRPKDCDQTDDGVGLQICETHRADVEWCTVCAVWWEPTSKGSCFDFGMAFALRRRFWLQNKSYIKTANKSFGNVLSAIASNLNKG